MGSVERVNALGIDAMDINATEFVSAKVLCICQESLQIEITVVVAFSTVPHSKEASWNCVGV